MTEQNEQSLVVAAMYKFVSLPDCHAIQQPLQEFCEKNHITGTLLLALEGINGTVAGPREGIGNLLSFLKEDPRFADLQHKESYTDTEPFYRMKVKIKKEIVTMGVPGVSPSERTGTRVDAQQWNDIIQDPEVVLIDTRNQYEYELGTFKNAISPETDSFREFPQYVKEHLNPEEHKKIAMFCTGGIRCEKASAYLLQQGFEEVYQLNGGILKYLEDTPAEKSLWQGECFVFDGRVAVTNDLKPGSYSLCYACRYPLSEEDCQSDKYEAGLSCPHCYDQLTDRQKQSNRERRKQMELAKKRNVKHIGAKMPGK